MVFDNKRLNVIDNEKRDYKEKVKKKYHITQKGL